MDWGLEIKKGDAEEGIGYTGHGITLLYEVSDSFSFNFYLIPPCAKKDENLLAVCALLRELNKCGERRPSIV